MARLVLAAGVLLNLLFICDSKKILVVAPAPSISHQVVFWPLTQELAKRGHEVTFITTDPAFPKGQAPANLTEIDFHDLSYGIWREAVMAVDRSQFNHVSFTGYMTGKVLEVFEKQLQTKEFQNILKNGKYDLLIIEAFVRPAMILSHIFKNTPVILLTTFGHMTSYYTIIGAPTHPFLYPCAIRQRLYNLTMWEKVKELWTHFYFVYWYEHLLKEGDELLKKEFGPDTPSITEMENNVDMLFVNMHPILDDNTPVPPGLIYIWGLHKKPQKEIPKDLKSYLDSSKNGVIYMSFGTNVDPTLLPMEKLQMFINVFKELPYDVLWKWNADELPGKPDNVKIGKWFPQSDLLRHPKVKLFITQGGLQSTDEAIQAKVPLLGIPMIADQWYNVEKYVRLGIGLKLEWESITEDQVRQAVDKILKDDSFKKNILILDETMRDEPMDGRQRAIWWTEYVLRHNGAKHLRAPAANISWAEYLELKLVAVVLSVTLSTLLIILFILYRITKFILRVFSSNRNSKPKSKRKNE